mgnify:CR=1 FL=1
MVASSACERLFLEREVSEATTVNSFQPIVLDIDSMLHGASVCSSFGGLAAHQESALEVNHLAIYLVSHRPAFYTTGQLVNQVATSNSLCTPPCRFVLQNSPFITGNKITVGDIALW